MKVDWKNITIKNLDAIVCHELTRGDIDAVLVGGACVSIYTDNSYVSYDLDFVSHSSLKDIAGILSGLGFKRESSRHFIRKDCPFFIEFVAPPVSVGNEAIKKEETIDTPHGRLRLLTPTDSVKDRLAAYYHWNDPQAREQAVMVPRAQKVKITEIRKWSEKEGHNEKFDAFLKILKA
ncbi:MAG: hypothetical protein JSU99_08450 [Nitrospiraceae bacterium]|nr:MAG: hypothetical protein JSU99_08450 [Nitrospiraceae bacterium]